MTKEQAISNLKEIIKLSRNEINKKNENLTAILDLTDLQSLDIVLYMLENQKERIDYLMRSIERKEQSLIEEHEENIECYTMIEKKDKIIDLMAEMISIYDLDIPTLQKQQKEKYCEFIRSDEDCCWKTDKTCADCIKQYFENEAKEVQ